jgi:predicted hydrocarbon binding protein
VGEGDPVSGLPALEADGRGGLTLGGARYLLIRPETLVGLQKAVEAALGEGAAACVAAGGRAGGARAAASLDGTADERVGRLLRIGGEIGWGEFTLERLTATELAVTVRHSPVAESYGPSAAPVCHLIRGVLESLAAAMFGRPSTVVETACVATGAPVCRFVAS